MSNIPTKEVVPRISLQLTLFVYELREAHDGTARLTRAGRCTWAVCSISSAWDARRWHSPQLGTAHDDPRCLAKHASARAGGEVRVHVRGL